MPVHKRFASFLTAGLCMAAMSFFSACQQANDKPFWVERLDPELDQVMSANPKIEILAQGFEWSEGPLWLKDQQALLFSDIPNNSVFKWTEGKEKELYLKPAGYTGSRPRGGELGSNALLLNSKGELVLCQHGDRRMAKMNAPLDHPAANFVTVVGEYLGKPFNSPNDAVYKSNGDLYFTDPPYGLMARMDDPGKAIPFQGVYRLAADSSLHLLMDSISRPNGIAFTPGEKNLIIANSDSNRPVWFIYNCVGDSLANGRIFYDATGAISSGIGLPDGLKVNSRGYVFATGPGGVFIFNSAGKLLGKIRTKVASSNVAFGNDENTIFITNHQNVLRVKLRD